MEFDHEVIAFARTSQQRERQRLMGLFGERRVGRENLAPNRAGLASPSAGTLLLLQAVAYDARHLATGDQRGAAGEQIFEQRAAAVAVAADINELGHGEAL